MEIRYKKAALKGLRKMPPLHRTRMMTSLNAIAAGKSRGLDIKSLVGREGFRLRQGPFRAIYRFEGDAILIMMVLTVGPRGQAYRRH